MNSELSLVKWVALAVMLFALGVQFREQKKVEFNLDVVTTSSIRLLLAPTLACLVAMPFGLGHIDYASGVLQAAMPTAVLAAIISKEYNIAPNFVTTVVLFSTLASLVTLTVIMVLL